MTSYSQMLDEARLTYAERRDRIANYTAQAAKRDPLAMALMQMDLSFKHRLAITADIGRLLRAVTEAHARDPGDLRRVLGYEPGGSTPNTEQQKKP